MNVTKKNFKDVLPTVIEKLQTCKFVSFDLEMSGIYSTDKSKRNRKDDEPAQRYSKMIEPATTYSIVQFGLSTFHENVDGTLIASPYNFYLFPEFGSDIAMSVSSIDFLRKNELNFGDWINHGVNYTDGAGEAWARKRCGLDDAPSEPRNGVNLSRQSDIDTMAAVFAAIDNFLESPQEKIHELPPLNGFLRRYAYEQVEAKYADSLVLKKTENSNVLAGYKIDKESKIEFDRKQREENIQKFEDMIGFRKVFNALVAAKKPVVGHNLLFDLMFVHRWLDCALPEDFSDFKKLLNANFDYIFDTKYVDASGAMSVEHWETTLEQCMRRYSPTKEEEGEDCSATASSPTADIGISSDCDFNPNVKCFHNAGYDAYCTGYVFAKQLEKFTALFAEEQKVLEGTDGRDPSNWNQSMSELAYDAFRRSCGNKTFMMQSLFHMSLDAATITDPLKHEGSVFRVSDFPKEVQTGDVLKVCSGAVARALGEASSEEVDTTVVWVDSESFFVVVNEKRLSSSVLEAVVLAGLRQEQWAAQTYADYRLSVAAAKEGKMEEEKEEKEVNPSLTERLSSWLFPSSNHRKKRSRVE